MKLATEPSESTDHWVFDRMFPKFDHPSRAGWLAGAGWLVGTREGPQRHKIAQPMVQYFFLKDAQQSPTLNAYSIPVANDQYQSRSTIIFMASRNRTK